LSLLLSAPPFLLEAGILSLILFNCCLSHVLFKKKLKLILEHLNSKTCKCVVGELRNVGDNDRPTGVVARYGVAVITN
jgi:hypothetical protein